jgi:hypothetical protein
MTQNEVRDKSELNPMEGGDELPEPAGKGAPQDAPADPQDTPGGAGQNRPSKSNQPGDE